MNPDFDERYSRHFPLSMIGRENQLKLRNRKVLVAGMGGLGTVSSELLASIGIGQLRIVDYDVVEMSNLPRQKLYCEDDIGKAKVEVAEKRLKQRNPEIEIDARTDRIDALSAPQLVEGMDLVIDALDKYSTRKALFRVARQHNIPFIFCGSIAEQANIMSFTHKSDQPCLQCAIGDVGDDPQNSCEIRGVHPAILQIASSIQVSEAVKILLGQESELEGTMMYVDLVSLDFDKFKFQRDENCRICSRQESDSELDSGKPGEVTKGRRQIADFGKALVTSLCGRDTIIVDPNWDINWNFQEVVDMIRSKYNVSTSGDKYITFSINNIGISLLESGVATIRGAKGSKTAISTYAQMYQYIYSNQI